MTDDSLPRNRREPRAADAGRVPRAQRTRLSGQGRRAPRPARVHVPRASRRAAAALPRRSRARGVGHGDTVAVMAPNVPALLEAHYAVPALGAVLNPLNVRLDAAAIAFCLGHGGAKVLLTDAEFAPVVKAALSQMSRSAARGRHRRFRRPGTGERLGELRYEDLLAEGDPAFAWPGPRDEWDSLALLYTSGTTGDPKGVVYHHRGAYLNALGNALAFKLVPGQRVPLDAADVPLLRLDVHVGGHRGRRRRTSACARVDPALIFAAIREHRVTHLCGAPIVLNLLIHAPAGGQAALRSRGRRGHRRRRAAVGGDRGDGGHGLSRHAPVRPHRVVRSGDAVRLAGRVGDARPRPRARRRWRARACRCPRSRRCQVGDPDTGAAGAARRHDAGRGDAARQHDHEGLPAQRGGHARRRSRTAGTTRATSPCGIRTTTSRSRTAARTSSSRAARTSARSRWRSACIATRR